MRLIALLMLVLIAGCSTSGVREEYSPDGKITAREYKGADASYLAYVAAVTQQAPDSGVDAAACAGDARCVENLAAFAALRAVAGSNKTAVAPPTPKRTFGDRVESITKATISALPGLGGIYASIEASKNQRAERETLYGTFGSIVGDVAALGAAPTYSAGGDIITGTRTETNIADSYNDSSDNSEHGDTISDSYNTPTTVTGDGNATGDGNIANNGDWRDRSDGPFDDHSDPGDDCTTSDCSVQLPPDPDPGT